MRSPKRFIQVLFTLAALALIFPLIKSNLYRISPVIQDVGERLALFAALSEVPTESRALLEQRFNDERFYPDEPDVSPIPNPEPTPKPIPTPTPTPAPQSSAPEASSSEGSSASSSSSEEEKTPPPDIPAKYQGDMVEEDLSGYDSKNYLSLGPGYLRNYTELTMKDIEGIVTEPPELDPGDGSAPQVLIYHTHATEAFERYDRAIYDTRNNWRSTDNNMNMVAVGDALAKSLEENGIGVIHDATQHDYPSYNGAYDRSAETIAAYQEQYPSLQILLDVHRDAIDRNGTLVRPITTIDGKKAAQLMIISGCDDGTMNMPNWRENLRFAAAVERQASEDYPRLMRPIFFCYRKYNFRLAPGALLLEFGSHGNTLEECIYTAELVGKSMAQAIKELPGAS